MTLGKKPFRAEEGVEGSRKGRKKSK